MDFRSKNSFLGKGISQRPLSANVMEQVGEKSVSATFVGHKGANALRAVLNACLQPEDVMAIQRKIVAGSMVTDY